MENNIYISIDMRKARLRLHKSTLRRLDDPKYIQLLVSPEKKLFAVRGFDDKSTETNLLKLSQLSLDHSTDLYSLMLINKLMSLISVPDSKATYRFTGYKDPRERIAVFNLDTLQQVEGDYDESD